MYDDIAKIKTVTFDESSRILNFYLKIIEIVMSHVCVNLKGLNSLLNQWWLYYLTTVTQTSISQ